MNYEEARDILLKKFDKLCGNYLYQNAEKIDYEQALYDGAQALEKQIPKKVVLGYDEQDSICCPQCNSDIASMDDLDDCLLYHCPRCGEKDAILQGDNYCFNCGQALDWSDVK